MSIAERFVAARRAGRALPAYPGPMPATMAEAYAIQDEAIALWGDRIVGWKVGMVPPQYRAAMGTDRLLGPIFARNVVEAGADPVPMPVFAGGFGAVEAEFVIEVAADADPATHSYDHEAAAALVRRVRIAIEPAGSPFSGINDHGPAVTASDFGNNNGLFLGPEITDWRTRGALTVTTEIGGAAVGTGGWESVPGSPMAAFAFALGLLAARGRPLQAGDLITTGAVTGIHEITPGQAGRVVFDGVGELACEAVTAGTR